MAFEPIPVLDLMGGLVVRARAGERDTYRPLEGSAVSASAAPAAVLDGLLTLAPFQTVYIADLDAIRAVGNQAPILLDLDRRYPEIEFWVDAGFANASDCAAFLATMSGTLVLGTESQNDPTLLEGLAGEGRVVLSLDSKGGEALDPAGLFEMPELWPRRLIAMTLGRVGMAAGPDLARLRELLEAAPDRLVYAAGGVRHAADLDELAVAGAAGALIASVLHDGRLPPAELARLSPPPRATPRQPPLATRISHEILLSPDEDRRLALAAERAGRTKQQYLQDAVRELLHRDELGELWTPRS